MSVRKSGGPISAFTRRLRDLSDRAGLSGREFATWLGVSKSTAENWLRGAEPRRYTLQGLQRGLAALESELGRKTQRLPPPITIRHKDRLTYVKRVRNSYR